MGVKWSVKQIKRKKLTGKAHQHESHETEVKHLPSPSNIKNTEQNQKMAEYKLPHKKINNKLN